MPSIIHGDSKQLLRIFAFVLMWLPIAASAWQLEEGRLGFSAIAEGEVFDAEFSDFTIRPTFEGALPRGFEVEIVLDSVDSGYVDRDIEMRGPDWLDAAAQPLARFRSTSVEFIAAGEFVTHGEFILKGVNRMLTVPFVWTADAQRLSMRGTVDIDRRWFGVGPPEDDAVAATVTVGFHFVWAPSDG